MRQATSPRVSIIVPVYKVEAYLPKCLDSILAQTFADFELLLIDDGSPDGSGRICDEYAARDPRVRVFHQANAGVSAARNTGLDGARGEWLAFVDSDDWVDPNWLDVFGNDEQSGISAPNLYLFGFKDVDETGILDALIPTEGFSSGETILNSPDFYVSPLWRCFFRREIIETYGIRLTAGMRFCEDTEFCLKAFAASGRIGTLNTAPYNYMHRSSSATNATLQDFSRSSMYLVSLNGFLRFCTLHGINVAAYGPCIKLAYRFFLRNYLFWSNPRRDDRKGFLRLYNETCELYPPFGKDPFWRAVSLAWTPSLLALRAMLIGKRFARSARTRTDPSLDAPSHARSPGPV